MWGGGLAGCTVGSLLRRAGVDVLMLEILDVKTKDKLCGGLILRKSADDYYSRIFGKDVAHRIDVEIPERFRKRYAGREIICPMDLVALQRKHLDDSAMESYLSAGGRLMDRTTVRRLRAEDGAAECEDLRTGESFTVRFSNIVGADGAMSAVRRLATGKKPRVYSAMETTVERRGGDVIFEFLPSPLIGYIWYIPQGSADSVIGCVCAGDGVPDGLRGHIEKAMEAFCEREGYRVTAPLRGAPLPLGDDVLLRAGDNVYFVGDAAGLIDRLGAGIWTAMLSGEMLAAALFGGTPYEESMKELAETLTRIARNAKKEQFLLTFTIMKKGVPCTPGQ